MFEHFLGNYYGSPKHIPTPTHDVYIIPVIA